MPERKSSRSKKSVDYNTFASVGVDFDDDFADSTPPASKRLKVSNKENVKQEKSGASTKSEKVKERSNPKSRPSLDERLYEKELQAALELSLSQDPSQASTVDTEKSVVEAASITIDDGPPSPVIPLSTPITVSYTTSTPNKAIEVSVSKPEPQPSTVSLPEPQPSTVSLPEPQPSTVSLPEPQPSTVSLPEPQPSTVSLPEPQPSTSGMCTSRQRQTTKRSKYVESGDESEGSDFALSDESDNDEADSDFNVDNDDSDFNDKKSKKKEKSGPAKKPTPEIKKTSTKQPTVKATTVRKSATVKPATSPKVHTTTTYKSPSISKPSTPTSLVKKAQSWSAPGPSGAAGKSPLGGVTVKSPSGGLRLGLSRNQRLKSLHPNLKV